jgi:hypothetical protein
VQVEPNRRGLEMNHCVHVSTTDRPPYGNKNTSHPSHILVSYTLLTLWERKLTPQLGGKPAGRNWCSSPFLMSGNELCFEHTFNAFITITLKKCQVSGILFTAGASFVFKEKGQLPARPERIKQLSSSSHQSHLKQDQLVGSGRQIGRQAQLQQL